jgi:hypothetical protein
MELIYDISNLNPNLNHSEVEDLDQELRRTGEEGEQGVEVVRWMADRVMDMDKDRMGLRDNLHLIRLMDMGITYHIDRLLRRVCMD